MKLLLPFVLLFFSTYVHAGIGVTPNPGTAGDNFKFYAQLGSSSPSDLVWKIEIGDGSGYLAAKVMNGSGTYFHYNATINSPGNNRQYRIGAFRNGSQVGSWQDGTYIVEEKPEIQYSPTVSINSASSSSSEGSSYPLSLLLKDSNSNLKYVAINWGDGSSNTTLNLSGGNITKSTSHTYSQSGTFTWRAEVFDHTGRTSSTQRTVSISSNAPTINSVSPTTSTSITAGDYVTFKAFLNKSVPSGYSVILLIDGAPEHSMNCSSSTCSYSATINSVGVSRKYTVYIKQNGTTKNSKIGYYTVKEKPVTQYSPTVSIGSADSSSSEGSSYPINLLLKDSNSDLKYVAINWGDGSNNTTLNLSGGHITKSASHTYSKSGTFTWRAEVFDHTGRTSSTQKTVSISSNVPIINTPYTNPSSGKAGSGFEFYVPLNESLPSGYSVQIEYFDGSWKFRTVMTPKNSSLYYIDQVISLVGNRRFRVGIYKGSSLVSNWKEGTFTVTEQETNSTLIESQNTTPTISISSASPVGIQNSSYSISLNMSDIDGNLKRVGVNWGDNSPITWVTLSGNSQSKNITHTYPNNGAFIWTATVEDTAGLAKSVSKSVSIDSNIIDPVENSAPQIEILNTSGYPIIKGQNFSATLKITDIDGNLEQAVISWGDGGTQKVLLFSSNETIELSHIYTEVGEYLFTLSAFDQKGLKKIISGNFSVKDEEIKNNIKITEVNVNSASGTQYEKFNFVAYLNSPLPKNSAAVLTFVDAGIFHDMDCATIMCIYSTGIQNAGENRKFKIEIQDNEGNILDSEISTYSVKLLEMDLTPPVLRAIEDISPSSSTINGVTRVYKAGEQEVVLKLTATGKNVEYIDVNWQLNGEGSSRIKETYPVDNGKPIIVSRKYLKSALTPYFDKVEGFSGTFITLNAIAYGENKTILSEEQRLRINVYNYDEYVMKEVWKQKNPIVAVDPIEVAMSCNAIYSEQERELFLPCVKLIEQEVIGTEITKIYEARLSWVDDPEKLKVIFNLKSAKEITTPENIELDNRCLPTYNLNTLELNANCIASISTLTKILNYNVKMKFKLSEDGESQFVLDELDDTSENESSLGSRKSILETYVNDFIDKKISLLNKKNIGTIDDNEIKRQLINQSLNSGALIDNVGLMRAKNYTQSQAKTIVKDVVKTGLTSLIGLSENEVTKEVINNIVDYTDVLLDIRDPEAVAKYVADKTYKLISDTWTIYKLNASLEEIYALRIAKKVLQVYFYHNEDLHKVGIAFLSNPDATWPDIINSIAQNMDCRFSEKCVKGFLSEDYETHQVEEITKSYLNYINFTYGTLLKIKASEVGECLNECILDKISKAYSSNENVQKYIIDASIYERDSLIEKSKKYFLYAFLANRIYSESSNYQDKPDTIYNSNWMLIDHYTELNGFHAGLYQEEGTNNYIVSYGGTTSSPENYTGLSKLVDGIIDLATDATLVSNFPFKPNQAQSAINYINRVYENNMVNGGSINAIVGHSLGGGLAQYAGLYFGIKTYTFNTSPMPFNNDSIKLFKDNGKLDNEESNNKGVVFVNKGLITNLMTKNDPLTLTVNSIMLLDENARATILGLKASMGISPELSLDYLIVGKQIKIPMNTWHSMGKIYEMMNIINELNL